MLLDIPATVSPVDPGWDVSPRGITKGYPIFKDDWYNMIEPSNMVIFHSYENVYQRVTMGFLYQTLGFLQCEAPVR
jgi:hypothetical protein